MSRASRKTAPDRASDLGTTNRNPAGIGFRALVAENFRTNGSEIFSQGFWTLFWHCFGNWRMSVGPRALSLPFSLIYRIMVKLGEWICGIMLPYTVRMGRRVRLEHFGGMILIAEEIGSEVTLRQNTTLGIARADKREGRPKIGDGADIGAGAVILGNLTLGRGAVVGAHAAIIRDVLPHAVVGGMPARLIRRRDPEDAVYPAEGGP